MTSNDHQPSESGPERRPAHRRLLLGAIGVFGLLVALSAGLVAVASSSRTTHMDAMARSMYASSGSSTSGPAVPSSVSVKIVGGDKKGSDGKMHDTVAPADFTVRVGRPLSLRIDNTDDAPHSITAPTAGVNIIAQPGVHTYVLTVDKAGRFRWFCALPCDNWAMATPEFMGGYITAS